MVQNTFAETRKRFMNKGTRYLLAFVVCVAIFALWVVFQVFIAKGVLVGVIFCSAMVGAWKAIVGSNKKEDNGKTQE